MNIFRVVLLIIFAISFLGQGKSAESSVAGQEKVNAQMLNDGKDLLIAKKPKEAIQYFEKVAADYEEKFTNHDFKIFSARTQTETLRYLLDAATENKGDAKVVSADWAYAYFYKAYALTELGELSESKVALERALALSPLNAQFLSELGNTYELEKNWPMALQTFRRAEKAAEFSPPESKNAELSRAWRGLGYAYVELNQIDEAEKMYRQCLELDKNDQRALGELRYVQRLRAKSGGR